MGWVTMRSDAWGLSGATTSPRYFHLRTLERLVVSSPSKVYLLQTCALSLPIVGGRGTLNNSGAKHKVF